MRRNTPEQVFEHIDMRTGDECWPWTGPFGGRPDERRPYYSVNGTRKIAYRLVYELVHGVMLRRDQLILHSCDRGSHPTGCCNPAHLRIGTVQDNSNDMMSRDRHGLSATIVRNIRRLLADGRTQQDIADLYGCSRETISAIATKRSHQAT